MCYLCVDRIHKSTCWADVRRCPAYVGRSGNLPPKATGSIAHPVKNNAMALGSAKSLKPSSKSEREIYAIIRAKLVI